MASIRQFAWLSLLEAIQNEPTILIFRHLLEKHELAAEILAQVNAQSNRKGLYPQRGAMMDAAITSALASTKNEGGTRDRETRQTKKGNQRYCGMKAHIGADADSGPVHTVVTIPANNSDVTQVACLLHGKETVVHADAGCTRAPEYPPRD